MKSKIKLTEFGFREDYDSNNRFDIKTRIKDYLISTVDLGIDHNIFGNRPLYYETMIFLNDDFKNGDLYQERYTTKEQAIKGHKLAIQYVLNLIEKENEKNEYN